MQEHRNYYYYDISGCDSKIRNAEKKKKLLKTLGIILFGIAVVVLIILIASSKFKSDGAMLVIPIVLGGASIVGSWNFEAEAKKLVEQQNRDAEIVDYWDESIKVWKAKIETEFEIASETENNMESIWATIGADEDINNYKFKLFRELCGSMLSKETFRLALEEFAPGKNKIITVEKPADIDTFLRDYRKNKYRYDRDPNFSKKFTETMNKFDEIENDIKKNYSDDIRYLLSIWRLEDYVEL